MQKLVTNSVEVSGYDLIITDASGNKQTIKDGLSSLFMGELQLESSSGEPITHDQIINTINGVSLGLDSVFFEDLITSDDKVANVDKDDIGIEKEEAQQEEQEELEQTLEVLQAQIENYKELIKEAIAQESFASEAKEVQEEASQQKEIKDKTLSEQLSQQLRPDEQKVEAASSQTADKPDSSSSSSDSSSKEEAKESVQAELNQPVLFISGNLDNLTDTGLVGDAITSTQKPTFTGSATPGAEAVLLINGKTYDLTIDENGAWTFELPEALEDGTHTYELQVTDPATGEEVTVSQSITIDTTASFIESGLDKDSDTGFSTADGITNNTQPTLTGRCEPNSTVTIQFGEYTWTIKSDTSGTWTQELPAILKDGDYTYTVTVVDAAGNQSSEQFNFTVDSNVALSASLVNGTEKDGKYITNQNKLIFDGKSEVGSVITLVIAEKTYTTTVKEDGSWQIKLDEALADQDYDYTITVTDIAGNTVSEDGNVSIKTEAPVVSVEMANGSDSGVSGDWITNNQSPAIIIEMPENCDIKVTINGQAYQVSKGEDGKYLLNINEALVDGTYPIHIEVTDEYGNVTVVNKDLVIDTLTPEFNGGMDASSDTGVSDKDGITSNKMPTLSGQTEPYASVKITFKNGEVIEVKADAIGKWSYSIPTELEEGTYTYTIEVSDAAGNKSSEEFSFTIDSHAEISASLINGTEKDGKYVTNQNKLIFGGKSEAGSVITLVIADKTYTTTVKEDGSWQIKLDEALADSDYSYTITVTDVAGNKLTEQGNVIIKSEAPVVSVELENDSDSGAEGDWITNVQQPVISINIPQDCEIKVTIQGKEYNLSPSEDGKYSIEFDEKLSDDTYPIHIEVTDPFGNVTVIDKDLVIDTQAPDIDGGLNASFDTGESNSDGITSNKKPMLSGQTEPHSSVKITFKDGSVVQVKADEEGNWNYQIPTELDDGTYTYTVEVSDAAGNITTESFEFTVDTQITLSAKLDPAFVMTNTSNDYSTTSIRPNLSGQTDPGAKVVVVCGGKTYETVADENGKWVVTLTTNATVGDNAFTVTSTDAAGNTTSTESKFVYIPDGVIPPYVTVELDKNSDTGKEGDNITSVKRPTLHGTATPGLTVVIKIGDQEFTTQADDEGNWSFEFKTDLEEGLNEYTVTVTDPETGLNSTASSSVFIDTGVPETSLVLENDRDTGVKGDFITKNRWPVFVGKSEPNTEVTIKLGDVTKTVTADAQGNWRVAWPNQMADNSTNRFEVTVTDVAGNKTESSINLVIDNKAPNLNFIGFTEESDLGAKDQVWTSTLTPTLTGTAEPGATITIANGNRKWTVTANEKGKWEFQIPNGLFPDNGREQEYTFNVTATDAAGNSTTQQKLLHFHKKKNFTTTVALTNDTDSDTKGDWVTTNKNPTFTGTINLDGGGYVTNGTVTINGKDYPVVLSKSGSTWKWSCTISDKLPPGELNYTVKIYDSWGNVATKGGKVTISNLSVSMDEASDSEVLGDKITNDNTPKLKGTCAPGAVVRVQIGNKIYDATVNNDGTWSIEIPELTDGRYQYTVIESNNGVTSTWNDEITIDTKTQVTAQVVTTGSAENTTKEVNPTLKGTGEPGAKIAIVVDGRTYHTTVNNEGKWQVTLNNANLTNGSHTVKVTSTDKAGNEASHEMSIKVDNSAPALQYGSIEEALQSQGACSINNLKPVLIGKGDAGATIRITVGGQVVTTTVESNGTWRVELPQLNGNVNGEHRFDVTIEAIDGAGNVTKVTTVLIYDNATQDFDVSLADASVTGEAGFTNDKTPTIKGQVEPGAVVKIIIDHQTFTVTANEKGEWSYTLPELQNGQHTVNVSYTDKAGNTSTEKDFTFEVSNSPISVADNTELNNGHNHYKGNTHTLKGTVSVGCKVVVTINGEQHEATVDEHGNWTLPLTELEDGIFNYTVTAIDKFGNSNTIQGSFVIDNDAPETTCELATDSGKHGDDVTNVKNPVFTGKTEPGAEVIFTINDKEYETTAGEDGRWQITVTDALSEEKEYSYTVTVVDKAGNEIETPLKGQVTISATNNQQVTEADLSDKMDLDNDNVTNNKSPQLVGKAPANAVVVVTIAGNQYEAKANEQGEWTLNIPGPLVDAKYDYTVQVKDDVGNLGPALSGSFTVDSSTKVTINGVEHEEGSQMADNMTNTKTPTLTGTAEPGSTVVVKINGVEYTANVEDDGTWTVTINNALEDKTYVYTVTTTDKAGNTAQVAGTVTVDTGKPLVNQAGLTDESETGIAGSNITKFDRPTFEGVTEPNATVILKIGDETFTFQAKENGHWEFTIPDDKKLSDGAHKYTVEVVDQAGNKCDTIVEGEITVSASKPSASASLQADTNTGGKDDFVTSNQTPTLCGKTKPGSIVVVTIGKKDYLAEVDSNGAWKLNVKESLTEGDHNFTVKVIDNAGNTNTESGKITIDLTIPVMSEVSINDENLTLKDTEHSQVDTAGNKLINDLTPKFEGKAEPLSTVQLTIGGHTYTAQANADGVWSIEVTHELANTEHHYSLVTTDQAGNQSVAFGSLTVDNQINKPEINDTTLIEDNKVQLMGDIDKDVESVRITIGKNSFDAVVENGKWSVEIDESLYQHEQSFVIEATDKAGNTATTEGTFDREVNAPEVDEHLWIGGDQIKLLGSADLDVTSIKITVNEKEYDATIDNGRWSVNIPQDEFDKGKGYTITAVDKAGNVSSTTVKLEDEGNSESTTPTETEQRDVNIYVEHSPEIGIDDSHDI